MIVANPGIWSAPVKRSWRYCKKLTANFRLVIASRDWHPADHMSFREQGGPWPKHCVQDTPGAEFHPQLDVSQVQQVFSKGTDPGQEAYSAFSGTDLEGWLRERGVDRLYVAGLATDYCVRQSVLDALSLGLEVVVLEDAVGAVNVEPRDGERALSEMKVAGARVTTVDELVAA